MKISMTQFSNCHCLYFCYGDNRKIDVCILYFITSHVCTYIFKHEILVCLCRHYAVNHIMKPAGTDAALKNTGSSA